MKGSRTWYGFHECCFFPACKTSIETALQNLITSVYNAESYLDRMAAETLATDSYQNILFSMLLFGHLCGRYPALMTIVTHDFKVQRFLDVHLPACRWPPGSVQFQGLDPPESVISRKALEAAEARRYVTLRDVSPRGAIVGPVDTHSKRKLLLTSDWKFVLDFRAYAQGRRSCANYYMMFSALCCLKSYPTPC